MAQFFPHSANSYARISLVLVLIFLAAVALTLERLQRSPYVTMEKVVLEQPVPFSHQHHVSGLGIDCRYCHTSVEKASFAGFPPTKTCMNCHSQIWTEAPMLEPVRASFRENRSLVWQKVHDLPDFAYFSHEIHVNKGVGCASCHGRVDEMPMMYKQGTLLMEWCLDCHRDTAAELRPRDQVFNMAYQKPSVGNPVFFAGKWFEDQKELGMAIQKEYKIPTAFQLTSCEVCHR